MERRIVACYDAADHGHFRPHRDNTTSGTAHRRFAVSLFLNSGEYEGGFLRFPEYGPALSSAPLGGAVVFSCSVLREATPGTRGLRYMFLPLLYDEPAREERAGAFIRSHLERHHLIVAEAEGEVVGFLAYRVDWFQCTFVTLVVVREDYRRKGIARVLQVGGGGLAHPAPVLLHRGDQRGVHPDAPRARFPAERPHRRARRPLTSSRASVAKTPSTASAATIGSSGEMTTTHSTAPAATTPSPVRRAPTPSPAEPATTP